MIMPCRSNFPERLNFNETMKTSRNLIGIFETKFFNTNIKLTRIKIFVAV